MLNKMVKADNEPDYGPYKSILSRLHKRARMEENVHYTSDTSGTPNKKGSINRKGSRHRKNLMRSVQKTRKLRASQRMNRGNNVRRPVRQFFDVLCNCRQRCNDKISGREREDAMKTFYNLDSYLDQNIFVKSCIKVNEVNRRRPSGRSNVSRAESFTYYFRNGRGGEIPVCKKYFRDTYQISDCRIYVCCGETTPLPGERDSHVLGRNLDDALVMKHINSFPAYTSSRNLQRRYLNPFLTIKKMYKLYVEQCRDEDVEPVKEKHYHEVFSTRFNLLFKEPLKETCRTCESLEARLQSSNRVALRLARLEKKAHMNDVENFTVHMTKDQMSACKKIFVFSFDSGKALAFPKLSTPLAYYRRNLFIYNIGCRDYNRNVTRIFVWPETEGSRGSEETASCLVKYITAYAKSFKRIIAYTDSGRVRNMKAVLTLLKLVTGPTIQANTIEIKFSVKGHNCLPVEADFSLIESRGKRFDNIFSPDDWYSIIETGRKPFVVVQMTHRDFLSAKELENAAINRSALTSAMDGGVRWSKIRWMKLKRSKPGLLQFKYNLDEGSEFHVVDLSKSAREPLDLGYTAQPLLYPKGRAVTPEKKSDMLELMKFIPPNKHEFYESLRVNKMNSLNANMIDKDIIYVSDTSITNNRT